MYFPVFVLPLRKNWPIVKYGVSVMQRKIYSEKPTGFNFFLFQSDSSWVHWVWQVGFDSILHVLCFYIKVEDYRCFKNFYFHHLIPQYYIQVNNSASNQKIYQPSIFKTFCINTNYLQRHFVVITTTFSVCNVCYLCFYSYINVAYPE